MDYWQYMYDEPSRWPQMYLYSKKDEIVDYKYIDSIVEHRKSLGVKVTAQCWEDSAHVAHIRQHRESYLNLCSQFLLDSILSQCKHGEGPKKIF